MKVFISGGCKNGKSTYAEKIAVALAAGTKPLYYIATMRPVDDEDIQRIERHKLSRSGLNFNTIEIETDIIKLVKDIDKTGVYLLDSLTALLASEMFSPNGHIKTDVHFKIKTELEELFLSTDNIVIVSDYIYSDAEIYSGHTKNFQKSLAFLDRYCAESCDIVLEACYGNIVMHKGMQFAEVLYEAIY